MDRTTLNKFHYRNRHDTKHSSVSIRDESQQASAEAVMFTKPTTQCVQHNFREQEWILRNGDEADAMSENLFHNLKLFVVRIDARSIQCGASLRLTLNEVNKIFSTFFRIFAASSIISSVYI